MKLGSFDAFLRKMKKNVAEKCAGLICEGDIKR